MFGDQADETEAGRIVAASRDAGVAPGHASTPGYADRVYPVTGRRPRKG